MCLSFQHKKMLKKKKKNSWEAGAIILCPNRTGILELKKKKKKKKKKEREKTLPAARGVTINHGSRNKIKKKKKKQRNTHYYWAHTNCSIGTRDKMELLYPTNWNQVIIPYLLMRMLEMSYNRTGSTNKSYYLSMANNAEALECWSISLRCVNCRTDW